MENLIENARTFMQWLEDLKQITSDKTGLPVEEIKINQESALEWFQDGFTPYQCFRETYHQH